MLGESIIRCPFCGHRYTQQSKILEKNSCSNCGKHHNPRLKWMPRRGYLKTRFYKLK